MSEHAVAPPAMSSIATDARDGGIKQQIDLRMGTNDSWNRGVVRLMKNTCRVTDIGSDRREAVVGLHAKIRGNVRSR
jgi:hypothetical protein